MEAFRYGDENDKLTSALISEEYDGKYWGESEDEVLREAEAFLRESFGEEHLKDLVLLDLGCGMGRLIPRFAALVGRVVALEPDRQRFREAQKLVQEAGVGNAETYNSDLKAYLQEHPTAQFDVVLCSHIFQHFSHNTFSSILLDLRHCTRSNAAFLFTTTHHYGGENLYSWEEFVGGKRHLEVTDLAGFENAMDREGVLPVCLFAKPWMTDFLEKHGLTVHAFRAYHFQGETDFARDRENNGSPEKLKSARDALYLCRRAEEGETSLTASGKVCFMQYFTLDGRTHPAGDETDGFAAEGIRQEFQNAENFLHGGKLHFPADRFFVGDLSIALRDIPILNAHAVVSVYREFGVCQVSVCLTVGDTAPDNLVYLHQIQTSTAPLFTINGAPGSIPDLCASLLDRFVPVPATADSTAIIIELNRLGERGRAEDLTDEDCRCLYGILTGDEGWQHVPVALARERATAGWTSRDFVRAIVFGTNFLLLNFNRSDVHRDYLSRQYAFACQYHGALNPYFTMDAHTAGVNHGLFFSVETGMLIKVAAGHLLENKPDLTSIHGLFLQNEIKKNKAYRSMMIKMLNRVEAVNITEMGELDRLIVENLRITQRIESIRYLLELLESDLDLLYDTNTNRMVNVLTILGLILALAQVILGIFPLFL